MVWQLINNAGLYHLSEAYPSVIDARSLIVASNGNSASYRMKCQWPPTSFPVLERPISRTSLLISWALISIRYGWSSTLIAFAPAAFHTHKCFFVDFTKPIGINYAEGIFKHLTCASFLIVLLSFCLCLKKKQNLSEKPECSVYCYWVNWYVEVQFLLMCWVCVWA